MAMEKQLVIFELGKEQFGIEIAAVEGIVKMQEITKVPHSPSYMEGITNLRGAVLPVICLKKRFGMPGEEVTRETRIITISMEGMKMGMIVSAVTEVLTIDESVIELPQGMITNVNSEFIVGVAKIDTRLVILLDLSRILSADEKLVSSKMMAEKI
jgi:purine-binding chemotaxis protein CheW